MTPDEWFAALRTAYPDMLPRSVAWLAVQLVIFVPAYFIAMELIGVAHGQVRSD